MTSGVLQSDLQQSIRDLTGTTWNVEGDFLALFDAESVPAGTFNERLKMWADQRTGGTYPDIMGSLNAYAVILGFDAWNNVASIPSLNPSGMQSSDGSDMLSSDGFSIVTLF
jgi:hypothetical protein